MPDWEKTRIVLVDPAIWRRYTGGVADLRPVHRELLSVLRGLGVEV